MGHRVYQKNKQTGVTYVYDAVSFWDKEKKQPRSRRICIGKLDLQTGDLIPSKRCISKCPPLADQAITATARVVGPSIILDAISTQLGLPKLLKSCFPNYYKQILTMAYYLVAEGGALCHCEAWCKSHSHPSESPLTSQRISEVLHSITHDGKQTFFKRWMSQILEGDNLCYDITSISSYSELNEYIKFGYNRDKEKLPQLNLAMLFGQKGGLPVYFERMPGNISDVTTVHNLLKSFKALEIKSLSFVMDKGFYSKKNIDELLASRSKFTISLPLNNKWLQQVIDEVCDTIHGPHGYRKLDGETLYVHSRLYPWGNERRRCYLHLYFNAHRRAIAIDQFNEELLQYKAELESGEFVVEHQAAYDTYFVIKTTPKRGTKVSYKEEAIKQYISRYAGFQAQLSNAIKDPISSLQVYRDKDMVEKCFDNLKNQLDMKRLRMHNAASVDGRLFIQFIALIYMSALRRDMRKSDLTHEYTVRELLQEMDTLTKVTYSGKYGHILTEVTKPQRKILQTLGIEVPHRT